LSGSPPAFLDGAEERICSLAILIPFRLKAPALFFQNGRRASAEIRFEPFEQAGAGGPCRCASLEGRAHVVVDGFRRPVVVGSCQRSATFGRILGFPVRRAHLVARLAAGR